MKTRNLSRDLIQALRELSGSDLKAVQTFIYFLRTRSLIDPAQAYFWTRGWQKLEREASLAKRAGHILGDGSVDNLLDSLHS